MRTKKIFKHVYKIGDTILIGKLIPGLSGFPEGLKVTVTGNQIAYRSSTSYGSYYVVCNSPNYGTYNVYENQINHSPITKEEISTRIKELKEEYELEMLELMNKRDFMEENGLETYDENEFKVYHTLSILDKKGTSKMDKAKLIAQLISGNSN